MAQQVLGLSSMATKRLLADLGAVLAQRCSLSVRFESTGGVEVARQIRAGAQADVVVLSQQQLADLDAEDLLEAGTLRPLFVSDVVAAVTDRVDPPAFRSEDDLRAVLHRAGRIAYSTGPSGDGLLELIERWRLVDVVRHKLVRAEPGTPVGTLLANGDADLGFQQRSEFTDVDGVRVLGPLPGTAAIRSTFSGAVLARSRNTQPARDVLAFLASEHAEQHIVDAGMLIA